MATYTPIPPSLNVEKVRQNFIGEIAERLFQRPTAADYRGAPTPLEGRSRMLPSAKDRNSNIQATLRAIEERLGLPIQYGGTGVGPTIRWQSETDTLVLDQEAGGGLQLSIHRSDELNEREFTAFRHGVGSAPHQVAAYSDLPYLWQLNRSSSDAPAVLTPPTPPASDWSLLEQSLRSLLTSLSDQLPVQLGAAGVGFNLVNLSDGGRVLAVLCNPGDELMALIDTTDSPDQWSPGHTEYQDDMMSRGWHSTIPLARWWEASFPRGIEGAAALAALIVRELRHRDARDPADLGLTGLSVDELLDTGDLGPNLGQLVVPGLGISH